MLDARRRHDWDQSAAILTVLINSNRDAKKQRAVTFDEIYPFDDKDRGGQEVVRVGIGILKTVFVDQGRRATHVPTNRSGPSHHPDRARQ